jgi:acyl-coenzyme A synthetase/AMP-(fatty) acid ligase/uncharacterized membrane protein/3-hydroxymyristoyl/3-hydroxydecanoyl-(acyl carrier protein) dehydratase
MKWSNNKKLISAIALVLTLLYPFMIYFLNGQSSESYIVIGLILVLTLRSAIQYRDQWIGNVGIIAIMLGLYFWKGHIAALAYPVLVSLSFAIMLGWSLIYPPTLIERFARLVEKDLDARGVEYTRKVTIAWFIFSLLNASVSLMTVFMGDRDIWLLYNAFISYLLIGILMGGEYIFRGYYKRKGEKLILNKAEFIPLHLLLTSRDASHWNSYWKSDEFTSYPRYIKFLAERIKTAGAKRIVLISEDRAYFLAGFLAALYANVPVVLPQSDAPELLSDLMLLGDYLLTNKAELENSIPEYLSMKIEEGHVKEVTQFAPLDPEDALIIFYTSGSTGKPKPVEKKLCQLEAEIDVLHRLFGHNIPSRFLSTVSHQHLYALLYSLLWPVCGGYKIERNTFTYWGDLLKKSKVGDYLISSPTHLGRFSILEECRPESFTAIFSSGALLSYEAAELSKKYLSQYPIEVYGSTETGGIAFRQQEKPVSAWRRFDCVELGLSHVNKLKIKSPYVSATEYYQTEDLIEWIDRDTFHLLGRADRVVKIEGKRVSLGEIENKLCKSEFVDEAAVVVLEKSYREELGALVVLSEIGIERLNSIGKVFFKRQLRDILSSYFHIVVVPRKWRFTSTIPTNAQGKRLNSTLKEYFIKPEKPSLGNVRHPILLGKKVSENTAEYSLKIPADLAYFDGHFNGMPIVPGVVQLNWVIELAKTDLELRGYVSQCNQIKFSQLMKPNDIVTLILHYNAEKSALSYSYKGIDFDYSSGRISFSKRS